MTATNNFPAILVVAALSVSVLAACDDAYDAVERECWEEWYAKKLAEVPKPDGTHHPVTGKPLSQTRGAIRTRAIKLQAFKDAMTLRGNDDPAWQTFRDRCVN